MNDSPIVTIVDRGGVCDVVSSENGFQGWTVVSGVTREQADRIAEALLPALVEKLDRAITAEVESLSNPSLEWSKPEHRDNAVAYVEQKRDALRERAVVAVDDRRA